MNNMSMMSPRRAQRLAASRVQLHNQQRTHVRSQSLPPKQDCSLARYQSTSLSSKVYDLQDQRKKAVTAVPKRQQQKPISSRTSTFSTTKSSPSPSPGQSKQARTNTRNKTASRTDEVFSYAGAMRFQSSVEVGSSVGSSRPHARPRRAPSPTPSVTQKPKAAVRRSVSQPRYASEPMTMTSPMQKSFNSYAAGTSTSLTRAVSKCITKDVTAIKNLPITRTMTTDTVQKKKPSGQRGRQPVKQGRNRESPSLDTNKINSIIPQRWTPPKMDQKTKTSTVSSLEIKQSSSMSSLASKKSETSVAGARRPSKGSSPVFPTRSIGKNNQSLLPDTGRKRNLNTSLGTKTSANVKSTVGTKTKGNIVSNNVTSKTNIMKTAAGGAIAYNDELGIIAKRWIPSPSSTKASHIQKLSSTTPSSIQKATSTKPSNSQKVSSTKSSAARPRPAFASNINKASNAIVHETIKPTTAVSPARVRVPPKKPVNYWKSYRNNRLKQRLPLAGEESHVSSANDCETTGQEKTSLAVSSESLKGTTRSGPFFKSPSTPQQMFFQSPETPQPSTRYVDESPIASAHCDLSSEKSMSMEEILASPPPPPPSDLPPWVRRDHQQQIQQRRQTPPKVWTRPAIVTNDMMSASPLALTSAQTPSRSRNSTPSSSLAPISNHLPLIPRSTPRSNSNTPSGTIAGTKSKTPSGTVVPTGTVAAAMSLFGPLKELWSNQNIAEPMPAP